MKVTFLNSIGSIVLLFGVTVARAQDHTLIVNAKETGIKVQPTMYGIFFEDINFAADGGLYAELVKNRSFEFLEPKMGWLEPASDRHSFNNDSGIANVIQYVGETTNHNYIQVEVKNPSGYKLINEGFRGIGVKQGAQYNLSLFAALEEGTISKIHFDFIGAEGHSLGSTEIIPESKDWRKYESSITVNTTEAKARLLITFEGTGKINLDMVSIFPKDTWKGRKNGMRKDIVQLLDDMNPGFLRFPGGCIVEGRTLAKRYQWKKTVGPIEEREILINRWNSEFQHKPAPDYFQSFGIGFFEYFQLAEDLGAEALPILGCGMACQFNTGELVPLEDLDPYVQDALDLIEFANGGKQTPWGKVRTSMGHPEPFHMKFIGIGNEQWGPEYIKRYKVFEKAIKEKYPNITIISGSGPWPEGDYFDYGWQELKKMNVALVDEHYYKDPDWFLQNADRYDTYDRKGPKVFAGEYAAHPKGVEDGPKENNWLAALSEAAFMTGLERNADVVQLTSYAPLLAHADAWQWAPDLIWFDNLTSYGTANYQVQKIFSKNKGTDVIKVLEGNQPLIGQKKLYASAVTDTENEELIIKLVNVSNVIKNIELKITGAEISSTGESFILASDDLFAINSFESPYTIQPVKGQVKYSKGEVNVSLKANSLTILKFKTK